VSSCSTTYETPGLCDLHELAPTDEDLLTAARWTRTHTDWAIDLEPLIMFTAALGDEDPRLRDEATDWCIRNGRLDR
jgi:hypothetical protein